MAFAFAGGVDFAAMRARDGAHDEEAEARALQLETSAPRHAIKALEDALQFRRGDADAVIA